MADIHSPCRTLCWTRRVAGILRADGLISSYRSRGTRGIWTLEQVGLVVPNREDVPLSTLFGWRAEAPNCGWLHNPVGQPRAAVYAPVAKMEH